MKIALILHGLGMIFIILGSLIPDFAMDIVNFLQPNNQLADPFGSVESITQELNTTDRIMSGIIISNLVFLSLGAVFIISAFVMHLNFYLKSKSQKELHNA